MKFCKNIKKYYIINNIILLKFYKVKIFINGDLRNLSNSQILTTLENSQFYSRIYLFFKIFEVFPLTSIECERVFS